MGHCRSCASLLPQHTAAAAAAALVRHVVAPLPFQFIVFPQATKEKPGFLLAGLGAKISLELLLPHLRARCPAKLKTSAYGNQSQSFPPTNLAEIKGVRLQEERTFVHPYGKINLVWVGREGGVSEGQSC